MSATTAPGRDLLPPGVQTGPLGRRFAAALLDWGVPVLVQLAFVLAVTLWVQATVVYLVLSTLAGLLTLTWALVVWYMLAVTAASPGMRLARLQLVGLHDGRPTGWVRVLGRQAVLGALGASVVGLVLLLVFLIRDGRHRGWHDRLVSSVLIRERTAPRPPVGRRQAPAAAPRPTAPATPPLAAPPAAATADTATSASSAASALPPTPAAPPPSAPTPSAPSATDWATGSGLGTPPRGAAGAPASSGPTGWVPPRPAADLSPEVDERARWGRPSGEPAPPASAASATPPPPASTGRRAARGAPVGADPTAELPAATAPRRGSRALDVDATRRVEPERSEPDHSGRAPDEGWLLALDDGREIRVKGLVLIGRNPRPRPGEEAVELVTVDQADRTVSKTHLAVDVDQRGLFVVDRGSTNGSAVAAPYGDFEGCAAGERVRVAEGHSVSFGENSLVVRRTRR